MPETNSSLPEIIGASPGLRQALDQLQRVAREHALSVLIEGEPGTGKELAAALVHQASGRRGPLVAINCAAIPGGLLESELFGHVKGAFTGAMLAQQGLFDDADGGTLFLDEVADMPLTLQAKVLRVVERREVRPVGGRAPRKVDVRIVCATNRNLAAMAEKRLFRKDLLDRLAGYRVELPPLRERGQDVLILARAFLKQGHPKARISRAAERLLRAYSWPGNVRELRNVILAAAVDSGRTIGAQHIRRHLTRGCELPSEDVAPASARVLAVIDEYGPIPPVRIRQATGMSRSTLRRTLSHMLAVGTLAQHGQGRATRYARPDGSALADDEMPRGDGNTPKPGPSGRPPRPSTGA